MEEGEGKVDGDKDKTSPAAAAKKSPAGPPRPETAWERGLRQAREMRKLAKQGRSSTSILILTEAGCFHIGVKVSTCMYLGGKCSLRVQSGCHRIPLQRKETDAEYEEKRTNLSLTQAEMIDRENDYYARKASPIRDEYDDDMEDRLSDYDDPYQPPPHPPPSAHTTGIYVRSFISPL